MPWSNWSRSDKIGIISLSVAFMSAIAAVLVVPEFREYIGLDALLLKEAAEERAKRKSAEQKLREAESESERERTIQQAAEKQVREAKAEIEREKTARQTVDKQLQDAQIEVEREKTTRQTIEEQLKNAQTEVEQQSRTRLLAERQLQEKNNEINNVRNKLNEVQGLTSTSEQNTDLNNVAEYFEYGIYPAGLTSRVTTDFKNIEYKTDSRYGCVTILSVTYKFEGNQGETSVYPLEGGTYLVDQNGTVYNFLKDTGLYDENCGASGCYKLKPMETWTTKWYFKGCINSSVTELTLHAGPEFNRTRLFEFKKIRIR